MKGSGERGDSPVLCKKIIVHHAGAVAVTGHDPKGPVPALKLGLDMHPARYGVVAQEDHATPKPARRLRPEEFLPWVQSLRARGHAVLVVYEACGFGFGRCRQLTAAGATCYVIAPPQPDEARQGVKTLRWMPACGASGERAMWPAPPRNAR